MISASDHLLGSGLFLRRFRQLLRLPPIHLRVPHGRRFPVGSLITRIQQLIYDEIMVIPLTSTNNPSAFGPKVKGDPFKIRPSRSCPAWGEHMFPLSPLCLFPFLLHRQVFLFHPLIFLQFLNAPLIANGPLIDDVDFLGNL